MVNVVVVKSGSKPFSTKKAFANGSGKNRRRALGDISNDGHLRQTNKQQPRKVLGNISNKKTSSTNGSSTSTKILISAAKPFYVDEDEEIEPCDRRPEKEHAYVDESLDIDMICKGLRGVGRSRVLANDDDFDSFTPVQVVRKSKTTLAADSFDSFEVKQEKGIDLNCEVEDVVIDDLLLDIDFSI